MSPHETGGPMTMALPCRQKAMVKKCGLEALGSGAISDAKLSKKEKEKKKKKKMYIFYIYFSKCTSIVLS